MSAAFNNDVIVIAPETNNQDGSQTYIILDPCRTEENLAHPNIEIGNLSAEVTNTGQIAVVSTNSTGALEITFPEESGQDKMEKTDVEIIDTEEEIIDDDFKVMKKELEEDVDIEELEYCETQEFKVETNELNSNVSLLGGEMNLEDDVEEGALYIDDVRITEEPAQNQSSLRTGDDKENSQINTGSDVEQVKNMIEQADFIIKEPESSHEDSDQCLDTTDSRCNVEVDDSEKRVAVIHGQVMEVPSSVTESVQNPSQIEMDSTNTALTLLELAGSTGRTSSMDTKVSEKAKLIAVSSESNLDEKLTQFATLTLPVTFSSEATVEVDQSSVSTLDPDVVRSARRMERLIEGDSPCSVSRRTVSTREIADEIDERTKQKFPDLEPSKDYIFAMKLAHRLATKIVDKNEGDNQEFDEKLDSETAKKGKTVENTSKQLSVIKSTLGKTTPKSQEGLVLQSKSLISDKIELLKILEDDPDDPDSIDMPQALEKLVEVKPRISSKRKSHFTPLLRLHPELEKELALKQLDDFKKTVRRKRSTKASEDNNNTSGRKRQKKSDNSKNAVDSATATADASQVTEFLTVEGQEFIGEQLKDSRLLKQYSNKRLSRSETPPLDLPMDLLLNGVEDGTEEKAKNKIFKATNPRKRKVELQINKKNHFANVLQRNKPLKKRGRPPKKKPILPPDDMLTLELLHKATTRQEKPKNGLDKNESESASSKEEPSSSSKEEKTPIPKTKKMREIDRLLGDEGAINLLFAIQEKQNAGGNAKRGVLPSVRRKKKDLILKTKLVKSAVLRLTNPSSQIAAKISLRGQQQKEESGDTDTSLRKMSVDSHDSHSISSPPPADLFPFPAKIVPAEASRIIRRHSSSSNYSSRSNSPRRLSIDGERVAVMSPEPMVPEMGQGDAPVTSGHKHKSPRTTQHLVKITPQSPKSTPQTAKSILQSIKSTPQPASPSQTMESFTEEKAKLQPTTREKKKLDKVQADKLARALLKPSPNRRGRPRKIPLPESELDSSLAAVLEDFTRDTENVDKNIPVETMKKSMPAAAVLPKVKKISTPVRQQPSPVFKPSVVYKELSLKRVHQVVEIILAPSSTKLKNSFNTNVLRELTSVLTGLTTDSNCRAVVISSTGSIFCQGVDFISLVQQDNTERKTALELAIAIKEFIKALALFSKVIVAAVQGPAVGLGVTMLPLFDLVLATNSATFYTPYATLGQIPEGGATLTMPTLLGPAVTSELLYASRKLTAEEALKFGLVTRVLPQQDFHKQMMAVVIPIASQSSQSMEATKALMRHSLHLSLETTLVSETRMLIQHWGSEECQSNFSKYLRADQASQPVPLALQDT